uniref:Uncharacterized protein n=1 Tax=Globodera pallida TaxID=36090 RepID=A0A183BHU7_GLOPA
MGCSSKDLSINDSTETKLPKVERPSQFPAGGENRRNNFEELKFKLLEKDVQFKTKRLQMTEFDIQYKAQVGTLRS